jgi:hypothetical protein
LASAEITHNPVTYIFEGTSELVLTADVTDNLGVKEVVVEYFVNEQAAQTVVMQQIAGSDAYTTALSLPGLRFGDEIHYRILARDMAGIENTSQLPNEGYFEISVIAIQAAQTFYFNNFNEPSNDFFGDNFSITTLPGFENGAIHSDHPYKNGIGPGNESDHTYQLLIPIRIERTNPVIQFDEVVLVEPGEAGSVFGNDDFFDYVIVEGSTDGGVTWKEFEPGYDSRAQGVWLTRYDEDIIGDNSVAQGDSTLYRSRTINMLESGSFTEGSEVLIRFRLFADQFAYGWGWTIDNLSIQGPVTGLEQRLFENFKVYPVPATDHLFIELYKNANQPVNVQITDGHGRLIYDARFAPLGNQLKMVIDVERFQPGLYVIKATTNTGIYTRKFFKVAP